MAWPPPFSESDLRAAIAQSLTRAATIASELKTGVPQPHLRRVERPSYEQLMEDVRTMSMLAVGRKYAVSDSAVREWIRWYERGFEGKGETEAA